jgi:alpha-glucosidase
MIAWKNVNALYQIYPRSFFDSNGDGVGDIKGIVNKIDYFKGNGESLGVDAIWLSPFFTSPMADFGYDISDYCSVDPIFGTLDDFKLLVTEAHDRDIRVMIDFVPNHTSDQHRWFKESRQDRTNSKRDYYVWADPGPDGGPPNNWQSLFFGSAWEFDETTGQYYLHSFLKEQPDLNWDNPKVRQEMKNILRFWMDIGVDGFRADAVWCISKDPEFRNNPPDPTYQGNPDDFGAFVHMYSKQGPNLFTYLSELTDAVAEYGDKRIIFEYYADSKFGNFVDQFRPFYTEINNDVGLPFNFEGIHQEWSATSFGAFLHQFQSIMEPGDTPIYCFGNHDQDRIVSKYGRRKSRMIALMQLTLPGLPTIYNGDEIGMENGEILPHQIRDPSAGQNAMGGRDPQRTPMQWSASKNAGFTTGEPWLPISSSYPEYNVKDEMDDPESYLSLYSMLLHLRRIDRVLIDGSFEVIDIVDDMLVYERAGDDRVYFVVMNFSEQPRSVQVPYGDVLFLTNRDDIELYTDDGELRLKGLSAVLIKMVA